MTLLTPEWIKANEINSKIYLGSPIGEDDVGAYLLITCSKYEGTVALVATGIDTTYGVTEASYPLNVQTVDDFEQLMITFNISKLKRMGME